MGKLFGTDGIRGVVNESLDAPLAYRIGQAAATVLAQGRETPPCVIIGKDTRISSDLLEGALTAGLCACGARVVTLGVIPTPAVSYLAVARGAAAGIVISASHNPFEYNGIKFFGPTGQKLSDEAEAEIEALILSDGPYALKTGAEIGAVERCADAVAQYVDHLAQTVRRPIGGLRVLIDCANGAASVTARQLFSRFPLEADFISAEPDGTNINRGCGSTHLRALSEKTAAGGYDLGIAFDGDADRCLIVDEAGHEVDGDKMMAICAEHMKAEGRLAGGGFVGTVMSNLGLHHYCAGRGLRLLCAPVGDRYVLEMMQREGMNLGGEQSGHIIFLDEMPTGDGQLAALHILQILCQEQKPISQLIAAIPRYPQVLLGAKASLYPEERKAVMQAPRLQEAIAAAEAKLGSEGRILIRPSGTEALIRVMVEARDAAQAQEIAEELLAIVQDLQM